MTHRSYITFSIDDGHPKDLRTADLLNKFELKATFYIPATNPEHPVMSASQIRNLAQAFEVGAHTYSHRSLTRLSRQDIMVEIQDGKKWLEDIIGSEVSSFCYPKGKFSRKVVNVVSECGFLGARTCMFNLMSFPRNRYLWGVTTHACSQSSIIQIRHALLEGNYEGFLNYISRFRCTEDWERQFRYGIDIAEQRNAIAHLYFHSWEIDQHGEWSKLKNIIDLISAGDLVSVENGELFKLHNEMVKK